MLSNINYVQNLSFWAGDNWNGGTVCCGYGCGNQECTCPSSPAPTLNQIDFSGSSGWLDPTQYYILKLYDRYSEYIDDPTYSTRYFQLASNLAVDAMNNGWNDQTDFPGNSSLTGNIHLIYHCDHSGCGSMGTSSCWHNDHLFNSDMDNLTSANYCQILYSDGCENNQFSHDCISKHYINRIGGGGVAFIGNSYPGNWTDVNYFYNNFCEPLL